MKMRLRGATAILGLAAGVVLGVPHRATADNLFWIGGNSSQYGDGQNWSYFEGVNVPPAGAIPGPTNFAVFEKDAAVSFSDFSPSQPPTSGFLQTLSGSVSFTLGPIDFQDASARTYTTSGLYVVAPFEDGNFLQQYNLPDGANASLLVTGGTLIVNGSAVIGGGDSKNVGTLTLQASEMIATGGLTVAQSAHGNLNIGAASYVVSSGGNVGIGDQFGSNGTATVSGGSTWLLDGSAPLTVGEQGTGSLLVEGGSLVSGATLNIGSSGPTPASVTVDGSGSQLSFTDLAIGNIGNGTLTISAGASVSSGLSDGSNHTSIGENGGMTGAATVTGAGSNWITNGLVVGGGNTGHGSLVISDGASVTSGDYLANINGSPTAISSSIGGAQSSVEVTGSGSSWTLTGGLSVSQYGNTHASLTVGTGSIVNVATMLQVNHGGNVQLDGTLNTATLNVDGGNFTQTGTVNISDASTHVGVLSISNGGVYSGAPTLGIPTAGNTDAAGYAYVQDVGSTWNIPGPYLLGAGGGPGSASVGSGGAVHSGDLGIGENTAGQLEVNGFGATWSSTGTIAVGTAASGTIDVENGGSISASTLTVNGQGSISATNNGTLQTLNLNVNGGSLKVNGGTLTSTSTTLYSGQVQLTDASWTNSGTLYVGGDGSAAATGQAAAIFIFNGSTSVGGLLKIWSPGQVNVGGCANLNVNDVDIEGGALDVNRQVNGSGGSLTIALHGEYAQQSGDFDAAAFSGITVNGGLLNIQSGSINLGAGQSLSATNGAFVDILNGSLNIASGASVSLADSTLNASNAHVAGNLTVSNTALTINDIKLEGTLDSNGGTVTSTAGITVTAEGIIRGDITIHGNVTNDGLLDVGGPAIGLDTIYGNLDLDPGCIVRIQVAGSDPSEYDRIMVKNGDVVLGGTLELDFINGFIPKQGDVFDIFIDDFFGSFSQVQVSGLGNWQYSVGAGPSGITLNSLSDAVAAADPVPEPGTLALLALGISGLLLAGWRRHCAWRWQAIQTQLK